MEYINEQAARELLERYFAGETSIEEEHSLGEYFARNDVPCDLAYAKAIFSRHRIAAQTVTSTNVAMPRRTMRRSLLLTISSVAAAAVIGVGVWLGVAHERAAVYCYINGIAVNNIEDARMQTRETFDRVDNSLSKAASTMSNVEKANRSAEKVEKAVAMMTIK